MKQQGVLIPYFCKPKETNNNKKIKIVMNCKSCGTEIDSNYCSQCGQPKEVKRIDQKYILHELQHVLHLEQGFFYTIRELALNPGENIRDYLLENRKKLVKPILFIILTSLIYTVLNHFFHSEDSFNKYYESSNELPESVFKVIKWVQDHYGYANIVMGIFIAFWLKLFFRKLNYNFYEILTMLCYVIGMGMLIVSVFTGIQSFISINITGVSGLVAIAYCVWAIGQFYNLKRVSTYIKCLFAYILGMMTFWVVPILIGTWMEIINK